MANGSAGERIARAFVVILIAAVMAGCSTPPGQSPYSMNPDAAAVEPNWGGSALLANKAEMGGTEDSSESGWAARVYQYRGGRNPKTGLAKIQM